MNSVLLGCGFAALGNAYEPSSYQRLFSIARGPDQDEILDVGRNGGHLIHHNQAAHQLAGGNTLTGCSRHHVHIAGNDKKPRVPKRIGALGHRLYQASPVRMHVRNRQKRFQNCCTTLRVVGFSGIKRLGESFNCGSIDPCMPNERGRLTGDRRTRRLD